MQAGKRSSRYVLSIVLMVAAAHTHAAPAPANDERLKKLEAWLAAVDAHRPGMRDAAIATIGSWKSADLDLITPYITILTELLPDPANPNVANRRSMKEAELQPLRELARREAERGDVNRIMKRGAVLHADIMMSGAASDVQRISLAEARREAAATGRVAVLGLDGHHEGYATTPRHWPMARLLLDAVHPDPASDDFVRLFYRATTAYLLQRGRWGDADRHLRHARERLTPHATLHLDSGCVYEAHAHPRVQAVMAAAASSKSMRFARQSVVQNLQQAEMHFDQALVHDSTLVEARIRRARVRTLLGRADEAVADLELGSTVSVEPPVRYYAVLFLGDAQQARGEIDRSREAYLRAAALYPGAQSPHLALSVLARETGDRDSALHALRRFLDVPSDTRLRHDPWWMYFMGSGRNLNALAVKMWAAVPGSDTP